MKNFLVGLLIGVLGTYWFLTQGDTVRDTIGNWWARASSPPATQRRR